MPNYFTVQPDYTRLLNKHFTPGRSGHQIKYIVRHHNAGVSNTDQTWSTWQSREASAHYQIEPYTGRVGQLVNDRDTAWSNGNSTANAQSITIEHSNVAGAAQDWPIENVVIDSGAKWAAALCWFYKLGRPQFGKNIRDHREFFGTSCPYHLANGGKYHARWMRVAQEHYDWMVAQAAKPNVTVNEIDAEAVRAKSWIGERVSKSEVPTPDGKGRFAAFTHGYIYFHPNVRANKNAGDRAIAVPAEIFEPWAARGWEAGPLGYPTLRHVVVDGATIQAFENGVIYRPAGSPGFVVKGDILKRFIEAGFEKGWGFPVSNEEPSGDGGVWQRFEKKLVFWHPSRVFVLDEDGAA